MPNSVAAGYDALAHEYASHLFHELDGKPYDRDFLDTFAENVSSGGVLDVGCGPGQVGRYLANHGCVVEGIDLSPQMIAQASALNPALRFHVGDIRALPFPDDSFVGLAAFYAIVHFTPGDLPSVFQEFHRVLDTSGWLAVSFHVGQEVRHVDELWGIPTSLDFVFFNPETVADALIDAGFFVRQLDVREPYAPGIEAQTQRAYILAQKASQSSVAAKP
jgi:SAM-dependent methyltransferase